MYEKVHDLTVPDGSDLDLNLILSSSVLQNALNSMDLSEPVSLSAPRNNIVIERMLTDESCQAQELASKMVTDKNAEAYEQVSQVKMEYSNVFSVRLKNGFSEDTSDDSSKKIALEEDELKLLLNRILEEYNLYLVRTYANQKLPNDEISVVEQVGNIELLDTLEQLRTALDNLYDYCDEKPDSVKEYRSYRDSRNLNDWTQAIRTGKETSVDCLYSYVYINSIIKDRETMITNYQYQLQNAQTKLDTVSENIATYQLRLKNLTGEPEEEQPKEEDKKDTPATDVTEGSSEGDEETAVPQQSQEEIDALAKAAAEAKAAQTAALEADIDVLLAKRESIMKDFQALIKLYNDQQINDLTVNVSDVKYNTPKILSGAFIKQTLKVAGPIVLAGFIVCAVLFIIRNRKEEKAK